jgi:hypothetical protein
MSQSLYALSQEYQWAFNELMEIPDLPAEVIADTLEGLAGDLEVKSLNVARFFQNIDAEAAAIKDAETRMAARRKALENKAQRLKTYLLDNMRACQISKISCPEFEISLRKNPPAVIIDNEALIPPEFVEIRTSTYINKVAIKAAGEVPGTHIEQGYALVIK